MSVAATPKTGLETMGTESDLKVDLHRHLEGSIRPATAVALGQAAGLFPCDYSADMFCSQFQIRHPLSLLDALERFDAFRRSAKGRSAVVRIVAEALADAAAEGITHLNLRFSPITLAAASGLSSAAVFDAVAEGVAAGHERWPALQVEPLAVVSRRRGLPAAWALVRDLEKGAAATVLGVDFAADELRHRTAEFHDVAVAVAALGLPLTVHTGEGTGQDAVAEALALPGVRRLGHALGLADSPALIEEVRARKILVEVCPTSNLRTGTVPSLSAHPARTLLAAGVRLAICSDDPMLFGIDLAHEWQVARNDFGLTTDDLRRCQQWARDAWFAGPGGPCGE